MDCEHAHVVKLLSMVVFVKHSGRATEMSLWMFEALDVTCRATVKRRA